MKLRDIVKNIKHKKASIGSAPYLEIGDIDISNKSYDISNKTKTSVAGSVCAYQNEIVISTVRPSRGAICILKEDVIISNAFAILNIDTTKANIDYVFSQLNSKKFFEYLGSQSRGATYPTCSKEDVLNYEIVLPNKSEQEKIAQLMNGLRKALTIKNKKVALFDELIKSRFIEMFGDPRTNSLLLETDLPENLCESISAGGDRPKSVSEAKTDEYCYPIYSNGEKEDGLYGWSKEYRIEKPAVTVSGRGTIGYASFRKDGKFTPIVRLIVLIPNKRLNPTYLTYFLNMEREEGAGSGVQQLTVPMIKQKRIIVPEKEKQDKFALFVEQVNRSKIVLKQQISVIKELLNSKIQEYFSVEE